MKYFAPVFFIVMIVLTSCEEDQPPEHFRLDLRSDTLDDGQFYEYVLTDSSFQLLFGKEDHQAQFIDTLIGNWDSLPLIAQLDIKAHDCREQHAVQNIYITFEKNGRTVVVDPNVNHPKELDIAVRIINQLSPPQFRLEFIDMQSAIEPGDRMQI